MNRKGAPPRPNIWRTVRRSPVIIVAAPRSTTIPEIRVVRLRPGVRMSSSAGMSPSVVGVSMMPGTTLLTLSMKRCMRCGRSPRNARPRLTRTVRPAVSDTIAAKVTPPADSPPQHTLKRRHARTIRGWRPTSRTSYHHSLRAAANAARELMGGILRDTAAGL